jgi:hypothetical protein
VSGVGLDIACAFPQPHARLLAASELDTDEFERECDLRSGVALAARFGFRGSHLAESWRLGAQHLRAYFVKSDHRLL